MKLYITLLLLLLSSAVYAEDKTTDKFLYFQFTHNVVISISNIPCHLPKYAKQLPWAAVAYRADGAILTGCYGPETADLIRIQWADIDGKPSDFTIIPANAFLMQPPENFEQFKNNKKPKELLHKELDV